jgi:hypothetical protein
VNIDLGEIDLDDYMGISIELENVGKCSATLYGEINGNFWNNGFQQLEPGEAKELIIYFMRKRKGKFIESCFKGMNGLPDGSMWLGDPIVPSSIRQIKIYTIMPKYETIA